ncbi:N-alpha-acetyltransferase 20 [Grus japonensis]|uniref:N-alpha-acetyltransferase 20 n=1 Tax=Grus japonensis TaxID=30415 RepID=A0ABC9XCP7_GRUJA
MEGSLAGSCLPLQARERLPRRAEDSRATGVTARRAGERSVCAGKLSRQRREPELRSGEPDEDARDMRKALSRDMETKSVVPHPVTPEDIE